MPPTPPTPPTAPGPSRRTLATGALALVLLATGTACGDGGGGSDSELAVALSSPVQAQEGQQDLSAGFEQAAEELSWDVQVYDANLSADTQVSHVQTMVDQQADGIAAWALDEDAIAGAYAAATAAEIPLVGVNSRGQGVATSVWWESNTCAEGGVIDELAAFFADVKPGARIAVISGPPAPSIVAMTECFTAAAEAAGLDIVSTQNNTQDTSAAAAALAEDLLSAHPDLDGFWTYNDASALGVSSAVLAGGGSVHTGEDGGEGLVITGVNGDEAAVSSVRNGTLTATVDTDPFCTGITVAAAVRDAIDGSAQEEYVVASEIVTPATVGDFVAPRERTCSVDELPLAD
ncbi:sugar ABC transporter substrate-binding protein [Streptomyces sp. PT12]|uniref:sugar ABC transporter substrate-binding protein n=1 Tax=Streptomyces sp. PT12 TaxID=1510197 RepID=UPI000DE3689A|nr:sugar ABC transporter substrate-binding protein [Streptomyces sp. PT12]RBM15523.1 sugar ABC transporter substrate-binding protein [Streptomyces sp. PT12]